MEKLQESPPMRGVVSLHSFVSRIKVFEWIWHIYVPLIYLLVVLLFFHSRSRFEFDLDEGINLIKALLVEKRYPLYRAIWSDQPPILTYLLALGIYLFGYKVGVARNIVLLLSLGLIWAAFEFLQLNWKRSCAYAGCLLIFLLPEYLRLSVSVMVGLPSISFGVISLLFLALWHKKHRHFWLILSAIFLGVAVLTKLMIGFLAPIFMAGILIDGYWRFRATSNRWDLFLPACLWAFFFAAFVLGILLVVVEPSNMSQLYEAHILAPQFQVFTTPKDTINYHLRFGAQPFLFLAIIGTVLALRARRWIMIYLSAWALTAYILLLSYQPVWYHHQLYITIPAAMLGGIAFVEGVDECLQLLQKYYNPNWRRWLKALALVSAFLVLLVIRAPHLTKYLSWPPSFQTNRLELGIKTTEIFLEMVEFAPQTQWIVTDLPMFAFRAGLAVPPEIAVISSKRLLTGNLTDEDILDAIQSYHPEQVLLGRYDFPRLVEHLNTNYTIVLYKEDEINLYFRNDMID